MFYTVCSDIITIISVESKNEQNQSAGYSWWPDKAIGNGRDAFMHEFGMIVKKKNVLQLPYENAVQQAPKLIDVARSYVATENAVKVTMKQRKIQQIIWKLDMALEETDSAEIAEPHRATAGLMLLPFILTDNASYFYSSTEVLTCRPIHITCCSIKVAWLSQ